MLNLIYRPIREDLEKVDEVLSEQLESSTNGYSLPSDIARHLVISRGKLLRPALVLLSSRLGKHCQNNTSSKIIKLASAIELIHTATLIHDDIIDEATTRRNLSSLNLKYGDDISVIIGDYLYANAFSLLSGIGSAYIMKVLADVAQKMCAGELSECSNRNNIGLKDKDYIILIEQKTASLISSCCQLGCFIGGGSKKETDIMADYGMNLGMAFQISDDCLDFVGSSKTMGKTVGSDIKNGKITLPLIYLLKQLPCNKRNKIIDAVKRGSDISRIINLAKEMGAVSQAYKEAERYADIAKRTLLRLNDFILKENLTLLTDYVVKRRG